MIIYYEGINKISVEYMERVKTRESLHILIRAIKGLSYGECGKLADNSELPVPHFEPKYELFGKMGIL